MNKLVLQPRGVVFDVGNVLVDWDPEYLFRKILPDPDRRRWFLTHVCSPSWHRMQDGGRACADGTAELLARFPGHEAEIEAFYDRWLETIRGPIEGTVDILRTLKDAGTPVFALSNFPREMWATTVAAHPFLGLFDDRVLSGEEGVAKPDRRIYDILAERAGLAPAELVFVDDREENLATAHALGFRCVLFEDADTLRVDLAEMGLPVMPAAWGDVPKLQTTPA